MKSLLAVPPHQTMTPPYHLRCLPYLPVMFGAAQIPMWEGVLLPMTTTMAKPDVMFKWVVLLK